MNTIEYEQQQTKLQVATREWFLSGRPNAFVTFTFRSEAGVSYRSAEKIFGTFAHDLKCRMFGKKSKKRILMIPIVEGYAMEMQQRTASANLKETHIHCLFRFPTSPISYKGIVRQSWVTANGICGDPDVYCPDGERWFKELDDEEMQRIYTNYIVKTCRHDNQALLQKFVPSGHLT